MKTSLVNVLTLAAGLLAAATGQAIAEANTPAEPMALRRVMTELGRHMQTLADGISREDWALVAKTAPLIADHPQPPAAEKVRIMGFFGAAMGKFKGHDEATHGAAQALGQAAASRDGLAVIGAFHKLQTSCYNCHREFRQPFLQHFYGERR